MSLTPHYPARLVCRLLDFPRCQLYRTPGDAGEQDAPLREALTRLAGQWPTYGYRRLTALLRREGWAVNGKRVRRVLAAMGLQGANINVLNGADGLSEIAAGLVGQGLAILDSVKKGLSEETGKEAAKPQVIERVQIENGK